MASISSLGIGSGLDIEGIISKLMAVEQQPLSQLNTKEASYQSKISALGSLQGAVSSLNSALAALVPTAGQTASSKFINYKASLSDSSIATATASSSSVPGTYSLEVTQLATTHRISTIARAHTLATIAGTYASADDAIAEGTLDITVGDTSTQITIDSSNATLGGLKTALNNANIGVTAEIVDDGLGGARLVITSETAGTAGAMKLSGLSGFTFGVSDLGGGTNELSEDPAEGGQAAEGGYTSADAAIAEGTLQLTIGSGTAHQITIDSTNNTLAGLRDAINAAGAGVTATLTTVSDKDVRLVLTSNTIGNAGKITMSGLEGFNFDPTSGTGELSQATADGGEAAQGSKIKLNGIAISNDSNTITNAVDGVTLTLGKVTTSAVSLTVSQDKSSSLNSILTGIVTAYNDLNTSIHDLGKYDEKTKTGGVLLGNSTLRTVSYSIKNMFQSAVAGATGNYKRLSDLGLAIQKDGSIVFDSSKLTSATSSDYEAVASMVASFGTASKALTDSMLGTEGTITAATDGAQRSIKDIDKRREVLAARLVQIEARYKKQFSALDSLIASMNSTSTYLTQQLASLPGASSSK
jgi:flagellar hook-associated protein 2